MRRIVTAFALGFSLMTAPVFAADGNDATPFGLTIRPETVAAAAAAPSAPAAEADLSSSVFGRIRRPSALPSLYMASAALQGYDAYSTLRALQGGAVEANPLMQHVVKSPAAFIGVKASVTVLSIVAAEKMWKRGNRMGAIGVMVASNVAMGFVAANNARVLSSLR